MPQAFRNVLQRFVFQLLDKDAVAIDAALGLTVGAARHSNADRQRGAVPRQSNHPRIQSKVLAAKLGADAAPASDVKQFRFQLEIAKRATICVAAGGEMVEVLGRSQLNRLQSGFGRSASDHEGQMVGRTGGRSQRHHLLRQKLHQRFRIQDGPRFLEQERLIC